MSADEDTPYVVQAGYAGDTDAPFVLSFSDGALIFPRGVQVFCAQEGAKALYVDDTGGIAVLREGDSDWREVPGDALRPAAIASIKRKE